MTIPYANVSFSDSLQCLRGYLVASSNLCNNGLKYIVCFYFIGFEKDITSPFFNDRNIESEMWLRDYPRSINYWFKNRAGKGRCYHTGIHRKLWNSLQAGFQGYAVQSVLDLVLCLNSETYQLCDFEQITSPFWPLFSIPSTPSACHERKWDARIKLSVKSTAL